MAGEGAGAASVTSAVEDVQRQVVEAQQKADAEIQEAQAEIDSLTRAINNLKQQLETLGKHRDELAQKREQIPAQTTGRMYGAIFSALRTQLDQIGQRAQQALQVDQERRAKLAKTLEQGDVAALLAEYEQFKTTVAPTLASLPASYRGVIEKHHESVVAQLKQKVEAAGGTGLVEVQGAPVELEVIYAVDAPEGAAELIMLVIPVTDEVQAAWIDRDEDVQTWIAARAVQGAYKVCRVIGIPHAQAMFGGHKGLLAVEIELVGGDADAIRNKLQASLEATFGNAQELAAVQVKVRPYHAVVDHLLPPEEEEGAGA